MCPPLSKLGVKWTEIECNYEITIVCIEKTRFHLILLSVLMVGGVN